jgi:tetratricopeptide (TPR) repeat protein
VQATQELDSMRSLYDRLTKMKNKSQEAAHVAVQIKTSEAWMAYYSGDKSSALQMMIVAADMEDAMEKHPVTPGSVMPARELLAEMYLLINEPQKALQEFEKELVISPNRFNAVYGAAIAAGNTNNKEKEKNYFELLLKIADPLSSRSELKTARVYLAKR